MSPFKVQGHILNKLLKDFSSFPVYITDGQGEQTHTITANGMIEGKQQAILTTSGGKTHFSPIGPLHLTAEEMNEILMKRALSAAQQGHTITTTTADGQTEIQYQPQGEVVPVHLQVQKVIQGLEEQDDSQGTSSTHCKLEPVMEISPKTEIQEIVSLFRRGGS